MARYSTLVIIGLMLCVATAVEGKTLYQGYHVLKATTDRPHLLEFLQSDNELHKIHVWHVETEADGRKVITFHANPSLVDDVIRTLNERGVEYQVLSNDLQASINEESYLIQKARNETEDPFSRYYPLEELQVWLTEQAALCGSNCQLIQIGSSFQNRPLQVFKLTGQPTSGCQQKPSIWIDAGIHAREWIAVSTGQFLLNRLIEEYDTDPFVKEIRDIYDWYFLPVVNPDGYSYSWTTDRMWRKTRQSYSGTVCIGADANRNFDFQWLTVGASSQPCSETFAGPRPNSEPEAAAQSEFMLARNGTWDLFITLHSYGQLWMAPYGYTTTPPENYDSLERVGLPAVEAIRETSGQVYRFGSAASILYQSSGTSRDWAAGVPRIPFVYTIELRNLNSFVLPPSEIRPTGEEIWAALKATVAAMRQEKPTICINPPRV